LDLLLKSNKKFQVKRVEPGLNETNNFRALIADGLAKQRNDCYRCKENNKKFEEKSLARMSQLFSRFNFGPEAEHHEKHVKRNKNKACDLKLPAIHQKNKSLIRNEPSLSGFYEQSQYSQFGGNSMNDGHSKPHLGMISSSSIESVSSVENFTIREIKNTRSFKN
jgi:hypothetical protein